MHSKNPQRRRRQPLSAEDQALFRAAVADVRPMHYDKVAPLRMPRSPRPQQRELDEERVLQDMLSDAVDVSEMETGEELLYARPGLQHTALRKLRRGYYSIAAELDLHGMSVAEARAALADFLLVCRRHRLRCVRIVHGKGNGSLLKMPILKGKVNHWLRQREEVLAFASARPMDGGTGAIYVLLKTR